MRLRTLLIASCLVISGSCPITKESNGQSTAESDAQSRHPNLIFVLSDDIAQGDLGCYGQKLIQTPRIDQMVAEGTRYLQAYCGTSVCAKSILVLHGSPHWALSGSRELRSPSRGSVSVTRPNGHDR